MPVFELARELTGSRVFPLIRGPFGAAAAAATAIEGYAAMGAFLDAQGRTYTDFGAYLDSISATYTQWLDGTVTVTEEGLSAWFAANP